MINGAVRGCFAAAIRDGSGAEFASIRSTVEGAKGEGRSDARLRRADHGDWT